LVRPTYFKLTTVTFLLWLLYSQSVTGANETSIGLPYVKQMNKEEVKKKLIKMKKEKKKLIIDIFL